MEKTSFARWFLDAIPRAPRRAGLLMRVYYFWQEWFTPAGRGAAALLLFSMFAGMVPGFWAAWIFCGLDFLFFLALVPTLFLTCRKTKVNFSSIEATPVFEGAQAKVRMTLTALNKIDSVSMGCYRIDPSLTCVMGTGSSLAAGETAELQCGLQTKFRGAYKLPIVAANIPEIRGMLQYAISAGSSELLVYPRPISVKKFPFLTSGASGMVFAPLLMPSLTRGLDFTGVREYREGDSLRDLHHKAFARYGKPFTKEFETERGAGAVLVLDPSVESFSQRHLVEPLIRLAAGVGLWLQERGALGRFFIGDEEFPLVQGDGGMSLLESLARIPKYAPRKTGNPWSPAARPMGPVLRLGLFATEDSLVHKQVILSTKSLATDDRILVLEMSKIHGSVAAANQEVSL